MSGLFVFADLYEVSHQLIVLLPTLDAVLERNQLHGGEQQLESELIQSIYENMMPWTKQHFPVIDNTFLSTEQTVLLIQQLVLAP